MAIRALAIIALVALSAAAAPTGHDNDWGYQQEWSKDFAESQAICRTVVNRTIPAAHRPSAAMARELKGCDAEALYYGIGRRADPVRARWCAILQMGQPDADGREPFSERAMLMTIYANGAGVRRDLDLATHFACEIEGSPAESDGRVLALAKRKTRASDEPFDYCQDITSGFAAGNCAAHEARITQAKRDAEVAGLSHSWNAAQRAAYGRLAAAREAFIDAASYGEVDKSGTLRGAFIVGEAEVRQASFRRMLQRLARGQGPRLRGLSTADAKLNQTYSATLASVAKEEKEAGYSGGVTVADVRKAQRLWVPYRDAWLAFAKAAYPAASQEGLATWLTVERTMMLENTPRSQESEEPEVPEPPSPRR